MAPLTTINSKGIEDGAIVNVDVDTSAAIAGTKIDPDFGAQNVVTTGTIASSDITIQNDNPGIFLTDTNHNDDFSIRGSSGMFRVRSETDTTDRFIIDSSGRIGINRTSWPDSACPLAIYNGQAGAEHTIMDIVADPNETSQLLFSETDDSGKGLIKYSHGSAGDIMTFHTNGSNAAAERLRIDSSGRLGIGDNSPSVAVSIKNTAPKLKFIDSDATGTPETLLDASGGDLILDIDKDDEKGSTLFAVKIDGSEKARITSGGNVGLSTTSPVAQTNTSSDALTPVLDLKGTGTNNSESGVLQLTRKDNATQGSCIYNSGDDGGLCLRNTDGNGITLLNGTTKAIRVDTSNNLKINDGDLVIGTSGHGIDFSSNGGATASGTSISSEHLDHYEEGTWTPAIGNDSNTYSYSVQNGRYTRIGSLLIVGWQINISSGDPDTSSRIVGLPFACADDHAKMKGMGFIDDRESGLCMVGPTGAGTSMMHLQNLNDAGSSSHTHGYCIMHIH